MAVRVVSGKEGAKSSLHGELVSSLREIDIVFEDPKGIPLKGGIISKYYVDVKKAYGYPRTLELIADAMWEQMDQNATCVIASGYGGVPLATVIAAKHNLKLVLLEEKDGVSMLAEYAIPNQQTLERMKSGIESDVDCIAASGHQALVAATLLSVKYGLKLTMIRDKLKGHGKPTLLDGYVSEIGEHVQIVCSETLENDALEKQASILQKDGGGTAIGEGIRVSILESGPEPVVGHELSPEKAVVVDDVTTTGGSLMKMRGYAEQCGAQVLGSYVVVKRGEVDAGAGFAYLTTPEELLAK